jgi:hypothetical protein
MTATDQGDSQAVELLLPLAYHELRKFGAQKLAQENQSRRY